VIFTTIHAQDFADCEGDRQSGRRTLPIVAPEGSRLYILTALVMWSMWLSVFWELGVFCTLLLSATGTSIGIRYYGKRIVHEDERSYRLYNVRILFLSAQQILINAFIVMASCCASPSGELADESPCLVKWSQAGRHGQQATMLTFLRVVSYLYS
jgi:hypothetical protein